MRKFLYLAAACLMAVSAHAQTIQLNEIRNDNGGSDFEYFEILNTTGGTVSLGGLTFLAVGDGAGGSGVVEEVTTLSTSDLGAGQTWLVAETLPMNFDTYGDSSIDLTVTTADQTTSLSFENNDNITYLLVRGFIGSVGTDLDINDDGVIDTIAWDAVVDAVSVTSPSSSDQLYATVLGGQVVGPDGGFGPSHIFRPPGDSNWVMGEFGSLNTFGTTDILENTDDTPGGVNPAASGVSVFSVVPGSIVESSFSAVTVTLGRPGTTGDVSVFVSVDDESEAVIDPLLTDSTAIIPNGQPFGTFDIFTVDDTFPDGDQTVTISAFPRGGFPVTASLTVTDDPGDSFELIINELNLIPQEDVNGDGSVTNADEFVEIINTSGAQVDLSGYSLRDEADLLHTFRDGTLLADGCSIVVFGDFGVTIGSTGLFGTAEVQVVSEGNGLQLTDSGDVISLLDDFGDELFSVTTPDWSTSASQGSYNLSPDATAGASLTYAGHTVVAGGPTLQSPGTTPAGAAYCSLLDALLVSTNVSTIAESAGSGALTVTVALNGLPLGFDLSVFVYSTDSSEIATSGSNFLATGVIPAGFLSTDIVLDVVDDAEIDGTQDVSIVAGASGFLNGTAVVSVTDDGDSSPPLGVCDIAFVAALCDNPDLFAFVALVEIGAGVEIKFTDNGWFAAGGFRGGEGTLTWTSPAGGVSPGTVVTFTGNVPDIGTATSGGPNLSSSGDQIFAYQGAEASPSFLAGIHLDGAWESDATNTNTSALPPALASTGAVAIDPEQDNAVYTGATTGSVSELKALLFDDANFTSSNTRGDVSGLIPSSFTIGSGGGITSIAISGADFAGGVFTLTYTTEPASSQVDIYRLKTGDAAWAEVAGGDDIDGTFEDSTGGPAALYQVVEEGGDAPANP